MVRTMRKPRARPRQNRRGRIDGGVSSALCEQTSIDYLRNMLVGASVVRRAKARLTREVDDDDFVLAAMRAIDGRLLPRSDSHVDTEKLWERLWRAIDRSRPRTQTPAPLADPIRGNLR